MAILIKDMELPSDCGVCPFSDLMDEWEPWGECLAKDNRKFTGLEVHDKDEKLQRPSWCPLADVDDNFEALIDTYKSGKRRKVYGRLMRYVMEHDDMKVFEGALRDEAIRMLCESLDDSGDVHNEMV